MEDHLKNVERKIMYLLTCRKYEDIGDAGDGDEEEEREDDSGPNKRRRVRNGDHGSSLEDGDATSSSDDMDEQEGEQEQGNGWAAANDGGGGRKKPMKYSKEDVDGAKKLWSFLFLKIFPHIFSELKVYLGSDHGTIEYEKIKSYLDSTDEAMLMLILLVKNKDLSEDLGRWKTIIEKEASGGGFHDLSSPGQRGVVGCAGGDSPVEESLLEGGGDGSAKKKRKGGRKKGAVTTGEGATELNCKSDLFTMVVQKIRERRQKESELLWYKQVIDELIKEKQERKALSDSLDKMTAETQGARAIYEELHDMWGECKEMERDANGMIFFAADGVIEI